MAIVVTSPGEGGAKEIVNITHKIDLKTIYKSSLGEFFFSLAGRIEDKVMNEETNMDGCTRSCVWNGIFLIRDDTIEEAWIIF